VRIINISGSGCSVQDIRDQEFQSFLFFVLPVSPEKCSFTGRGQQPLPPEMKKAPFKALFEKRET
jgi:hypothetical protein